MGEFIHTFREKSLFLRLIDQSGLKSNW